MYLEINIKQWLPHHADVPSGDYDMGKGNTYATHLRSHTPKQ